MYPSKEIKLFIDKINEFVAKELRDCIPQKSSDKIIHDPIWGSVLYYNWEIQLIDTPIFQRLRGISQLGMADLTYPAAHHSRYEHSLGTVAIASRMIEKLRERYTISPTGESYDISLHDLYVVRLTALLHDIGHCVYSHLSEQIYKNMPEFETIKEYIIESCGQKIAPKPHELFSYLIITASNFCAFFSDYIDFPQKKGRAYCQNLLRQVANMVIGVDNFCEKGDEKIRLSFMTDIINSDFDADKLDYTQRDSYTTGIALTYGVDRFLMKLLILKQQENDYTDLKLAITADSLTTVEELIFNRKILYVYMYRHQKVLSTEAVIKDLLYGLTELKYIRHPSDFLYLSDADIERFLSSEEGPFPKYAPNRKFTDFKRIIKNRAIPKRCLTISKSNLKLKNANTLLKKEISLSLDKIIKAKSEKEQYALMKYFGEKYKEITPEQMLKKKVTELCQSMNDITYSEYIGLREKLYKNLCREYKKEGKPIHFDIFDLHIVFPPILRDKNTLPIMESNGVFSSAEHISYISEWGDSFSWDKWKGFFFTSPFIDKRLAYNAAISFLKDYCSDLTVMEYMNTI